MSIGPTSGELWALVGGGRWPGRAGGQHRAVPTRHWLYSFNAFAARCGALCRARFRPVEDDRETDVINLLVAMRQSSTGWWRMLHRRYSYMSVSWQWTGVCRSGHVQPLAMFLKSKGHYCHIWWLHPCAGRVPAEFTANGGGGHCHPLKCLNMNAKHSAPRWCITGAKIARKLTGTELVPGQAIRC